MQVPLFFYMPQLFGTAGHLFLRPFLKALVLLLCEAHERAMLRTSYTLDIYGVVEFAQLLVGLADAVVAWTAAVFDVSYAPSAVTHKLESRCALALLVSFKLDIIIRYGFGPRIGQLLAGSGEDARCAALFLDHHVEKAIRGKVIDVGIDGGITPVEKQLRLGKSGECLVGIRVVHAVVFLFPTVPHGVINHVASLLAIGPAIIAVPNDLRSPYAVDSAPVLIDIGRLWVTEDGSALEVVESDGLPKNQII